MKTRAAIVYEHDQPLVVEDVELDAPAPGQALVKLTASGVCHSDLSVIDGTIPLPLPAVLGHEGAGIVEEVGAGVKSVKPGDTVMMTFVTPCGHCFHCSRGRPNICIDHWTAPRGFLTDGTQPFHQNGKRFHQMARIGTFADYTVVSANALVPVPSETPLDKAALIGCGVTTGVGAVINTAKVEAGSSMAVIGIGGVGVNVIQGGVLSGAEKIIAIDVVDGKLEAAREFGATHTVNSHDLDPVETVMGLTDEVGVDYAFEVIGNPKTVALGFDMTRTGGAVVMIGVPRVDATLELPAAKIVYGERRVLGSMYGSSRMHADMPRLLRLYRTGKLKVDELVTETYAIEQVNEAFDDLRAGKNIRGLIDFAI